MQKAKPKKALQKPQHQCRSGIESKMTSVTGTLTARQHLMGKLKNKVVLNTCGDKGIGGVVAFLFVKVVIDNVIVPVTGGRCTCLADKRTGIDAVASGSILRSLRPSGYKSQKVPGYGDIRMKKVGGSVDVAPFFLLQADSDGSNTSSQVIRLNGGEIVNR